MLMELLYLLLSALCCIYPPIPPRYIIWWGGSTVMELGGNAVYRNVGCRCIQCFAKYAFSAFLMLIVQYLK